MPRTRRTRGGKRRKHRKGKGITSYVPGALRHAIAKTATAARKAARGLERPVLKLGKKGVGEVLKPRFGGMRGGSYTEKHIRSLGGSMFSDLAGSVGAAKTAKKGGRYHKGKTHHRRHKRHGGKRTRRGGRKSRRR